MGRKSSALAGLSDPHPVTDPRGRQGWPGGISAAAAWLVFTAAPALPPQKLFPALTFVSCCLPFPAGLVHEVLV